MLPPRTSVWLLALVASLACGGSARSQGTDATAGWDRLNIGRHAAPGNIRVDDRGLWTLRADNLPFSPRSDSAFFVHRPLTGDGSVVSLLIGVADGEGEGTAGVALRESGKAGARSLFLGLTPTGVPTIRLRRRSGQAEVIERWAPSLGPGRVPVWLRWQREGDRFTPFASQDGYGWTQLHAPISLPGFPRTALAGIAGFSSPGDPLTAVFDSPTVLAGQLSPLVRAAAGNGAALLTWAPLAGAAGYVVRRGGPGASPIGADLVTPEPIRESSIAFSRLPNGQAARFLVSALFDRETDVEGWATAVTVTPTYTPYDLFGSDFNAEITAARGAFTYDLATGTYQIAGAGDANRERADAGFLAGRWLTGDFQVTVQLLDRPAHQAGLMLRDALDGPARAFFLTATSTSALVTRYRMRSGAAMRTAPSYGPPRPVPAPIFLRLVRRGATLSAFQSDDGVTFAPAGRPITYRPALPESLYVGCAVVAPDARTVVTHRFRDLTIE